MKRRDFLRISTATVGSTVASGSAWAGLIERALALPANNPTGVPGLSDVEHVIIFMQENRSLDHYFGSLNGVRGFGDPRPAPMPSGNYVWYQPEGTNAASRGFSADVPVASWNRPATWYESNRTTQSHSYVLPFRLNQSETVAFQYLGDLNHSWKQSQDIWKNWDGWVPLKSRQSMGFLNATDLPFYHPLATAFSVCDAYHCSVFAATDPNRFYLWSGTCPPPMNFPDNYTTGGYIADIAHDNNSKITPAMYGQSQAARNAAVAAGVADWKTYAETLTENRITWKIYQELDNYGDNYLQYFKNFRIDNSGTPINASTDPHFQTLYQRGRVFAAPSANLGDALIEKFASDVAAGMEPDAAPSGVVRPGLPRVSWIVAPYKFCEHPSASPGDGEAFTARLMDVLVNRHPEVFQKTVCMMMYDENDGYFDHVTPPVPPVGAHYGQMTLADAGAAETMSGIPVGLGPRVPMLVISPWTKGGKVSSQVYDHTSVIRFLEQWLTSKQLASAEANRCRLISPWRRSVCGDLTELFDFRAPESSTRIDTVTTFKNGITPAYVPLVQAFPALPSPETRTACALGYSLAVRGLVVDNRYGLHFANMGSAGVALVAYWMPMADGQTPFHYTIEAGKSLSACPVAVGADGIYDWAVHGPNGFLREYRGSIGANGPLGHALEVTVEPDGANGGLRLVLDNRSSSASRRFRLTDLAYSQNAAVEIDVAGGSSAAAHWTGLSGWHDVGIRIAGDVSYFRRVAGYLQPARGELITDPAGSNAHLFKPAFSIHREIQDSVRFDYVTPPWHHRPQNWIGVFHAGAAPVRGTELTYVYAPRGVGSVLASTTILSPGQYDAWYLFDNSYTPLAGPMRFEIEHAT